MLYKKFTLCGEYTAPKNKYKYWVGLHFRTNDYIDNRLQRTKDHTILLIQYTNKKHTNIIRNILANCANGLYDIDYAITLYRELSAKLKHKIDINIVLPIVFKKQNRFTGEYMQWTGLDCRSSNSSFNFLNGKLMNQMEREEFIYCLEYRKISTLSCSGQFEYRIIRSMEHDN